MKKLKDLVPGYHYPDASVEYWQAIFALAILANTMP